MSSFNYFISVFLKFFWKLSLIRSKSFNVQYFENHENSFDLKIINRTLYRNLEIFNYNLMHRNNDNFEHQWKATEKHFFKKIFFVFPRFVCLICNKILCPDVSRFAIPIVKSSSNLDLATVMSVEILYQFTFFSTEFYSYLIFSVFIDRLKSTLYVIWI